MGEHFQFRCDACAYTAEVSGGADVGMSAATQTIACAKCERLFDVVTSEEPWNARAPKLPLRCPKRGGAKHPVKRWKRGGPCPRCGERLRDTGMLILWD